MNHQNFSEEIFKKSFFSGGSWPSSSFQYFNTHLRFSLESGCKITALQHILQIFETLFCWKFASVHITHWFSKDAVKHKKQRRLHTKIALYLIIIYRHHHIRKAAFISVLPILSCPKAFKKGIRFYLMIISNLGKKIYFLWK